MVATAIPHTSITAGQALEAARMFIADQLTDLMGAGIPWRMRSPFGGVWIVPVWIAYPGDDRPNTVGSVAVDEATGNIVSWTPVDEIMANSILYQDRNSKAIAARFASLVGPIHDS